MIPMGKGKFMANIPTNNPGQSVLVKVTPLAAFVMTSYRKVDAKPITPKAKVKAFET